MTGSARAHISKDTLDEVIARATNASGDVCCAHCQHPITDDQILTIQHAIQRSALTYKSYTDPRAFTELAERLGIDVIEIERLNTDDESLEDERFQILRQYLNASNNLSPMHNACHREVDFGMVYTPAEAAEINRKGPKQDNDLVHLKALSTPILSLEGAKLAGKILLSHRGEVATILRREKDIEILKECREQLQQEMVHFADLEESHERPKLQVQHVKHEGQTYVTAIAEKMEVLNSVIAKREAAAEIV